MPSQPASTFRVIPICWLLTVDSEMGLFLFHSLAEGVLVLISRAVQEKFMVNSKVNFNRKTDMVLIALCFMRYWFIA